MKRISGNIGTVTNVALIGSIALFCHLVTLSPCHLVIGAGAGAGAGLGRTEDKDEEEPVPNFAKLERGMTPEQVRRLVGAPHHIARQILYHRYREQWIYEASFPVRLTFDCLRGQKPQLLSVLRLPIEKDHSNRGATKR